MSKLLTSIILYSCLAVQYGCLFDSDQNIITNTNYGYTTFKEDLDFLKSYTDIVLLRANGSNAMVAVSPALQGRVMTSSSNGFIGRSYGWINRSLFESGDTLEHINPYGGEERLWLGPEGGQYSIFFKKDQAFNLENWQTPRLIDIEPFTLIKKEKTKALFRKNGSLTNYSNYNFKIGLDRTVEILSKDETLQSLGIPDSDQFNVVSYRTTNVLTNTGTSKWSKETGLLSIWILGMFNPSDKTTVIIPYISSESQAPGSIVNDNYFGEVPGDRLIIENDVLFFRGDGQFRSKIGLNSTRALFILGSYDSKNQVLTIVKYNKPGGNPNYVNSLWNIQEEPYNGDVVNSYNDGPPAPNAPALGPFYELETSSPALMLAPGESGSHIQYTYHFEGEERILNYLSEELLSVSLDHVKDVFK